MQSTAGPACVEVFRYAEESAVSSTVGQAVAQMDSGTQHNAALAGSTRRRPALSFDDRAKALPFRVREP